MRLLAFICRRRGHNMVMKDYMPESYSVWKCSVCGIREDREIDFRTGKITNKWGHE